jgi:hypothetical protein
MEGINMNRLVITRLKDDGMQTLGAATLYNGLLRVFDFVTLEPSWKDNQRQISCIPAGRYTVTPRNSPRYKDHFHVKDVNGRDWILIHQGNFRRDSTGCLLVGREFSDLNKDGFLDITASRLTLEILLQLAPEGFILDIVAP